MRKLSRSSKVAPVSSDEPPVQDTLNDEVPKRGGSAISALVAATSPPSVRPESRVGKRFLRYDNSWKGRSIRDSTSSQANPGVILENDEGVVANESKDPKMGLIEYFSDLSKTDSEDIDFDKIEQLLSQRADVNAISETTGQSVFHDIATNWDTDVAQFMLENDGDIHIRDNSGRTPLHMAAASDHKEMVVWLLEHGAELEVKTHTEEQTPIHYAARNDAINTLQVLIDWEGNYEVRDYKGRTPLHLAGELDRTLAADYLLSLDIPAECRVVDNLGNHAITSMIRTMPKTALRALNQLHRVAPVDRKQFFLLSHLEPEPGSKQDFGVKTPFETAVEEESHDILSHPVMQELIRQKWTKSVRWYFYFNLALYIVFLLSWSVLISYPSVQEKHKYVFPRDIWRIILELLAIGTYVKQIVDEVLEYIRSKRKHKCYTRTRSKLLQDDLKNTDPNQPEERKYLENELRITNKSPSNYFKDPWNIIDIITYITLGILIVLHAVDIGVHREQLALWAARLSCGGAILIWARLLKLARGFRVLGPLVAIIGQLIGDILRYFALYAVFFIPYVICFWVLFGGDQSNGVEDVDDLTKFYRVAIMMFRMSLIDDYPYMTLRNIDELMSAILVITFLLFTAVIGLNLFIALLSDTFQRVYDNAQANAILQQARIILSNEETMFSCTYQRYLTHIHNNCNPRKLYYDDDDTGTDNPAQLQKITHQIYDIVSQLKSNTREEEEDGKLAQLTGFSESLVGRLEQQEEKMLLISQHLVEIKTVLFALQQQTGKIAVRAPPTLEDTITEEGIYRTTSAVSSHGDVQQTVVKNLSPLITSSHRRHQADEPTSHRRSTMPVKLPPLRIKSTTDLSNNGSTDHHSQPGSTARTQYSDVMSPRTRQILYGDHQHTHGSTQSSPWPIRAVPEALYTAESYTSLGSSLASPSHRRVRKRKSRQEELEESKWLRKLQLAKDHKH